MICLPRPRHRIPLRILLDRGRVSPSTPNPSRGSKHAVNPFSQYPTITENYAVVAMKSPDISRNRKASLDKSITSTSTRASPTTAVSNAGRSIPPSIATTTTKQQQEEQQTLLTQRAFSLQDHKP